jgi:predicted O-methyltransferase YrrM
MNLRKDVPDGTYWLDAWNEAYAIQQRLAPGTACCMGIATRQMTFKIIRAMGAKRVLDIGTYIGFSALNYALAVGDGGLVVTVDVEEHFKRIGARDPNDLWSEAGVRDRIWQTRQDSRAYLRATPLTFDFISIDGWHEDFAVYEEIKLSLNKLNPDGLIFLDDVQPPDYVPNPGCDKINGPYKAIQRTLRERPDLHMIVPNVPDRAVAFLVQA